MSFLLSRHRATTGQEALLLALPFRAGSDGSADPQQDAATGQLFFMVGVSEIGGSDPLAWS